MDYLEVVKNWRNKRIKDITDLEIALEVPSIKPNA